MLDFAVRHSSEVQEIHGHIVVELARILIGLARAVLESVVLVLVKFRRALVKVVRGVRESVVFVLVKFLARIVVDLARILVQCMRHVVKFRRALVIKVMCGVQRRHVTVLRHRTVRYACGWLN